MRTSNCKLFLMIYGVYFFGSVVQLTAASYADVIKYICTLLSLFLCFIDLGYNLYTKTKIRKKGLLTFGVLCLISVIAILARDYFIIWIILMGLTIPRNNERVFDKVCWISIGVVIFVIIGTIFLCMLGIVPNVNTPRDWNSEARYAWGFEHSQIISILILYCILYYFLIKKCIHLREAIISVILEVIIAIIFDARNALYSLILFFAIYYTSLLCKKVNLKIVDKIIYKVAVLMPVIMSVFIYIIFVLFNKGNMVGIVLDSFLSGRLRTIQHNISVLPIKLLNIISYNEFMKSIIMPIDSGYVYIFFRYGIIYLIILFLILPVIVKYFASNNNILAIIVFIIVLISAGIANSFVGCYFLPFWVIVMKTVNEKIWKQ